MPNSSRIRSVLADPEPAKAAAKLLAELAERGSPLIEPQDDDDRLLVTFVFEAPPTAETVSVQTPLAGLGVTGLERIAGTDVWYTSASAKRDARVSYQFCTDDPLMAIDPATADPAEVFQLQVDRLPRTAADPFNPVRMRVDSAPRDLPLEQWMSVLTMPDAPPEPWAALRSGVARGAVDRHEITSSQLGNTRRLWVYTPPGYNESSAVPIVVLLDGRAFRWLVDTDVIVDNLTADGLIRPPVVVMLDNATMTSRMDEYDCQPAFAAFVADEVLPWLRATYDRVSTDPADVVIGGVSYGGLGSAYGSWARPDAIGNVLSMSGSFWYGRPDQEEAEWLTCAIAEAERRPVRWWMNVGDLESVPVRNTMVSMVSANRHLRTVLQAKGYEVAYSEYSGGHDFAAWRATLPGALMHLLPRA